ncbi:MAG: phosphoenolpyruvate--protein phosphotransferase [Phycisphaerae bacterium]
MIQKKGINASPGVAIGPALVLDTEEYRIPRRLVDRAQTASQVRTLVAALEASRQEVAELRVAVARKLGENTSRIFDFHEACISDERLRKAVVEQIEKNQYTAAYAFSQEMNRRQREFRALSDPYFRERVRDLFDIEKRVLRHILGREREDITRLTEPVIIVANDITPSQAVTLDRQHILGFALDEGGQTSHMAIIARKYGIPAVVALNDITSDITGGQMLVVDGTHGIVIADPDERTVERYRGIERQNREAELGLRSLRDLPAVTTDGVRLTLMSNIELPEDAALAVQAGAEGVGLYRTEFLFLAKDRLPSEDEQYASLRTAVEHLAGRPITIRTMDLGADKISTFAGPQHDHNPDLGLRSLRYCLQHLDLFKTHLRAILRASAHGDVRIMFPMITTIIELRQAKATLADVMEDLDEEDIPFRRDVPVGIMIETPSAAMMAATLAREVRFFSIGTNDLTQYVLAVDRANERVAHLYQPHNPAVLRLIRHVVLAAARAGIEVELCGEMAGMPIYTMLLTGLGLRHFSMAAKDMGEVKRIVRSTTIEQCHRVARAAVRFDNDRQVMNFLRDELRGLIESEDEDHEDQAA